MRLMFINYPFPNHETIVPVQNQNVNTFFRTSINIIKIPYLLTSSMGNEREKMITTESVPASVVNQIYKPRYYDDISFAQFTHMHGFEIGPRLHPLEEAHKAWAHHLLDHINKNDLLYGKYFLSHLFRKSLAHSFERTLKRSIKEKVVPFVCILSPLFCYLLDKNSEKIFSGYLFGNEMLILNGLITFVLLFITSRKNENTIVG
jgi:hypothetical protein